MIADGPQRLSKFREEIEDDRESMSKHFTAFKANVSTAIGNRQWFLSLGALPLGVALAVFVAIGALLFYLAISGWRSVYPRWSDIVLLGLGVAALVNAALIFGALTQRRLWRRRSRAGRSRPSAGRRSAGT